VSYTLSVSFSVSVSSRISSPKAYLMREAIKGGNQRISSPKAYLMREAIKGGNQRGTHRNSGS
jgi:predicted DNA-binding protein